MEWIIDYLCIVYMYLCTFMSNNFVGMVVGLSKLFNSEKLIENGNFDVVVHISLLKMDKQGQIGLERSAS